jgi:mannosyltransferase
MRTHAQRELPHDGTRRAERWHSVARNVAFLPVVVGIFAMAVSLISVGIPSLWADEAATVVGSTRGLPELLRMSESVDAVHAFYYAMMHFVFEVFGYSPVTLRAPSAVAVGGAAALTVVLGRQLDSTRLGLIAGVVYAVLPRTTWSGIEGRSFAFTSLLAVALTVVFIHAIQSPRKRWWFIYGALTVISGLMFIYLTLIVVAHAITLAIRLVMKSGQNRAQVPLNSRIWIGWATATAGAVVLLVPFLLFVMGQTGQVQWLGPLGAHTRSEVIRSQWFLHSPLFAALGWLFLALGLIRLVRSRVRPLTLSVIVPLLVIPTAILLIVSALHAPIYNPRYLAMCLPFVATMMAVGIEGLRGKYTAVVAVTVIAAVAVPQYLAQRVPQAREKDRSPWSQVADSIAADRTEQATIEAPETAVVYGSDGFHGISGRVIAHSYPDAFVGLLDITERIPAAQSPRLWAVDYELEASLSRLDGIDQVYVISGGSDEAFPGMLTQIETEGFTQDESWDISEVRVVRLSRE